MSEWFGSVCVMSFNVGPQTSTRVDKCVHRTLLVSTLKKTKPVKTNDDTVIGQNGGHNCYTTHVIS